MVVIGGYNSSNTCNLARHLRRRACRPTTSPTPTASPPVRPFAIARWGAARSGSAEIVSTDWLPAGALSVGLTAGASTPNNIVGRVVQRIADLAAAAG